MNVEEYSILSDYAIPETAANRDRVRSLIGTHGVDGARRILTGIHGTPDEIAAGHARRQVHASNPAVNGRVELGLLG